MLGMLFLMFLQVPKKIDLDIKHDSCYHFFNGAFEFSCSQNHFGKNTTFIYRLNGENKTLLKKLDFYTSAMERSETEWIFGTINGDVILYSDTFELKRVSALPVRSEVNKILKNGTNSAIILAYDGSIYNYDLKTGLFVLLLKVIIGSKLIYAKKTNLIYIYNLLQIVCYDSSL